MTKTVALSLEQVKKDAEGKGMEVIDMSAFPFQHLKGIIIKKDNVTIYAWELSENKTRLDRA